MFQFFSTTFLQQKQDNNAEICLINYANTMNHKNHSSEHIVNGQRHHHAKRQQHQFLSSTEKAAKTTAYDVITKGVR